METYKAKLSDELWNKVKDRPDGKLVLGNCHQSDRRQEREKPRSQSGLDEAMAHIG